MWNALYDSVFQWFKNAFTFKLILIQIAVHKSFTIKINTFKWTIDCALMQNEMNKKLHSIIYDNHKLQRAKLNYFVHEKKLLVIKYVL